MTDLVTDVETFLARTRMNPQVFGRKVCRNSRLVERLRSGGDVQTRTADKIRSFIVDHGAQHSATSATVK
jgi:hypothetical protein